MSPAQADVSEHVRMEELKKFELTLEFTPDGKTL